MMKPPRLHIIAWSMLKDSPHTHLDGLLLNGQSYLNLNSSLNSRLFKLKPISEIRITLNQVEAPFSEANSMQHSLCPLRCWNIDDFTFFVYGIIFLLPCNLFQPLYSGYSSCLCDWICSTNGAVIFVDAAYSTAASWHGFVTPRPPFLTGSARISRSSWVHSCSVIAGRKTSAIAFSNGCSRPWMSGSVRRNVHRCFRPKV